MVLDYTYSFCSSQMFTGMDVDMVNSRLVLSSELVGLAI